MGEKYRVPPTNGVSWPRMLIGNVTVDLIDRQSAISLILGSSSSLGSLSVAFSNLDHIRQFRHDESWLGLRETQSVSGSAQHMPWHPLLGGNSLVRAANILSGRRWPKLTGAELIHSILKSAADLGLRVGFLGGPVDTHNRLGALADERIPGIDIVGSWAPTRTELSDRATSERIAAEVSDAGVDILVVELDTSLQEDWIASYGLATGAGTILGFGADMNGLPGCVDRPTRPADGVVAEQLWRLKRELGRLIHRHVILGPPALLQVARRARVIDSAMAELPNREGERGRFVSAEAHAEVAVIVVTYNSESDIPLLIDDLRRDAYHRAIRLIIVDCQSPDATVDSVRAHDDIKLVEAGGNLGYSGGINVGLPFVGSCDAVMILNPDLRLAPDAMTRLLEALGGDRIGAVVPLMLDEDGATFVSLRREPSLTRAVGDALFGSKFRVRPGCCSEIDFRPKNYLEAHDVDWATGAALLITAAVASELGDWNEEFFMYSEETEYFRRIREHGYRVRFDPSAIVIHRRDGSGASAALAALMAVNRIRYVEQHHGRAFSVLFRATVALAAVLRSYQPVRRRTLAYVLDRERWQDLPQAAKRAPVKKLSGPLRRGAVIVPAYNEEAVIKRTLSPLSEAAVDGFVELIVVCNGCSDKTADIARTVPGVQVLELENGSKPAALNAGDEAATLWPRLYLDADIQISIGAALAVLDRLTVGDVMVARPDCRYDTAGASALVRSYYRARGRIPQHKLAMWGAGVYGLSAKGHQQIGAFPMVTGDDLYVDTRFAADHKAVVPTEPSVVKTPSDVKSLLAIRRRGHRGGVELSVGGEGPHRVARTGSLSTAAAVARTIRGPRSTVDAIVYLSVAVAARWSFQKSRVWERDESSRSTE